jgi:DNA-binding NarL/FixJ family response regulator
MKAMRTGILDDHPLFVEGLSAILSNYPWIDLVFRGEDGVSLRQFLQEQKLDLLFLDINLGKENGIELAEACKRHSPAMRIIILSTHQPADIGLDMSSFLGDAYMLKISGRKVLEEAIKKVCNGETYIDPNLTIAPKKPVENPFRLTKREYEIIELIRQGCTTREIAERLFLSELTIKTHRRNISEKLDSRNVAEMLSRITKK